MEKFVIEGKQKLEGEVKISGSKNAALPIIAASIMGEGKTILHNIPNLKDVQTILKILNYMGVKTKFENNVLEIDPSGIYQFTAPYEFVSTMRGSICLLGPLLAKYKTAKFSMPGGCVIGPRPIDLHLKGLKKLGVKIENEEGYIVGKVEDKLKGNIVFLGGNFGSSVLATANVMCAATLAEGETIIEFAACEPEIVDLANFLKKMGAKIYGEGSHLIRIEGVKKLKGTEYTIIPDRIEAGTYILAGYITKSRIKISGVITHHLLSLFDKIEESGLEINFGDTYVETIPKEKWKAIEITTLPYPGFPTDLQAQIMSFLTLADGVSLITEKVFPERFIHVGELNRLGADITLDGSKAIIKGVSSLKGAKVMASDLRASAALVLAALAAEGTTEISRIYHLDRGYEKFEKKLSDLGAKIKRVKEET
ncbi:MAG: UDP-N-acetylglucosamine 1-carboxyvinyltransferase [Candidatus Omnitrophica bacterium]|nr:UDP-N-acetylglucosamine 1-carboxyvinyltransferase [Candidatus Omnitrophota bacterium]MCM8806954.1 UDP-N-acetylglucosamine 1-carboxyvinyltransferase [Candidatus Omnitrophota bacterium]